MKAKDAEILDQVLFAKKLIDRLADEISDAILDNDVKLTVVETDIKRIRRELMKAAHMCHWDWR